MIKYPNYIPKKEYHEVYASFMPLLWLMQDAGRQIPDRFGVIDDFKEY